MPETRARRPPKVVVLGMMTRWPYAGVIWQTLHYVLGFEDLGYETYYVEAHGGTPRDLLHDVADDPLPRAAAFLHDVFRRFDLGDRWAYDEVHGQGRTAGMTREQLGQLCRDAALVINLHGGTEPRDELRAGGSLVFLETDPVEVQVQLAEGDERAVAFLAPHDAFFTFAERLGQPGCLLPAPEQFTFLPTRQPVVLDLWGARPVADDRFTTVGNWRQHRRIEFGGETYHWSKHLEFEKLLALPSRTGATFELGLGSYGPDDVARLHAHGWNVVDGRELSRDLDRYRDYVSGSGAELTVAKDQNVRLRTGWFSDRSATYLAAGRPVITQDTGFESALPTGDGLFAFVDLDGATAAVEAVNAEPARHRRAALDLACEHFAHDVVLGNLLEHLGEGPPRAASRPRRGASSVFPDTLDLEPRRRRPLELDEHTAAIVRGTSPFVGTPTPDDVAASVVVTVHDQYVLTRLCLETLLSDPTGRPTEVVVVDNASGEETAAYLRELAATTSTIRLVRNEENVGFPRGVNQGVSAATAPTLVILNNDVIPTPGWMPRLLRHLEDETIGAVGPTTNRIGNEAEIRVPYRTLGGLRDFAIARSVRRSGRSFDIPVPAMFCLAVRRTTWDRIGWLDEGYDLGLFEDDDYAKRLQRAGLRTVCAEDVFVHHFGGGSFGTLVGNGTYARLFERNLARFEARWGSWEGHARRVDSSYSMLVRRIAELVDDQLPGDATVAVVSRGDAELLELGRRRALHFPAEADGVYAGWYPADSLEAIRRLEDARRLGVEYLLFPEPSLWWLQHYDGFARHLAERYHERFRADDTCVVYDLASTKG